MAGSPSEILLWLFVINLGIVFGAGLYEARVVVPLWASAPPESLRSPDSGRRFWGFAATVPLTLLCIANLITGWQAAEPRRIWWLAAAGIIFAERIFTFAYFIPTMLRLQRASMPQTKIEAAGLRWARLNYLRNSLTLAGWLAALKALSPTT
jgi:hypothetical protein